MISCKICHRTYKTLTGTHLFTHDIGVLEYKKKYRVKYIHSRQARKKIGILKLGNKYTAGKRLNVKPVDRQRSRERLLLLMKNPAVKRKLRQALKGNKNAQGSRGSDYRKRRKMHMLDRWQDTAYRKRMSKLSKRTHNRPAYKKLISDRFKKLWRNPKWRARMISAQKSRSSRKI